MTDPYFTPEPLDVETPSPARYSQALKAEVTDAFITAQMVEGTEDEALPFEIDEFLASLWRRGFKIVPNGDGQWVGDDNEASTDAPNYVGG